MVLNQISKDIACKQPIPGFHLRNCDGHLFRSAHPSYLTDQVSQCIKSVESDILGKAVIYKCFGNGALWKEV